MIRNIIPPTPDEIRKFNKFPNLEITSEYEVRNPGSTKVYPGSRSTLRVIGHVQVMNSDGSIIERRTFQSKSFVANFLSMFYEGVTQNAAAYTAPAYPDGTHWGFYDRTHTLRTWSASSLGPANVSYAVGSAQGLILGTGSSSPTPASYNLTTTIAHGNATTQLFYLDNVVVKGKTTEWPSAGQTGFMIQRAAINNSGGSITVSEMGLSYTDLALSQPMLAIMDVITPIPVPANGTIAWGYTIYAALPAVANLVGLVQMVFAFYWPFIDAGNWPGAANYYVKKIDGSNQGGGGLWGASGLYSCVGGVGSSVYGIVFGTTNTAPTTSDYKLGTLIVSGSASTQLNYAAQSTLSTLAISGQNTSFSVQRVAVNNSGATITPVEEGISTGLPVLLSHALINGGSGYAVLNGGQITGNMTFATTT
jgi:hypothetical protein